VGEVGRVSGGDFPTLTNTFSSGNADAARVYLSAGLRFGW